MSKTEKKRDSKMTSFLTRIIESNLDALQIVIDNSRANLKSMKEEESLNEKIKDITKNNLRSIKELTDKNKQTVDDILTQFEENIGS